MLWDLKKFILVNSTFHVKLVQTGLCSQRNGHWKAQMANYEKSLSEVKETKPRKGKELSLWLQPKNRIQAQLALWLEAGRARESDRQIIWSSNPGLSTNFLCLCYPEEQNDTSTRYLQGREAHGREKRRGRHRLRGCKKAEEGEHVGQEGGQRKEQEDGAGE